jgi:threonine dehydrogenase-like Zn-dependent dehydrogenase
MVARGAAATLAQRTTNRPVFGAGGLGHLAIRYARITGASVVAVDINPARLWTALAVGAEHIVNAAEEDSVAAIQRLGGADAAISTAVTPTAFEQAFRSLARDGRLVCVGLPAENHMKLPIFETVLGGLEVRGSIVSCTAVGSPASSTPSAPSTTSTPPSSRSSTAAPPHRGSCSGCRPQRPRSLLRTMIARSRRRRPVIRAE